MFFFAELSLQVAALSIPPDSIFIRGYAQTFTFHLTMKNMDPQILIESVSGERKNFNTSFYLSSGDSSDGTVDIYEGVATVANTGMYHLHVATFI